MKVVIPMAGLGSRFKQAADQNPEYQKPKPFISVHGRPMIQWATDSLPFTVSPKDLIFIVLEEHDAEHNIIAGLKNIYGEEITVIPLAAVTRGAAETAYQAMPFVDPDEEIIISDSDHFFDGSHMARAIEARRTEVAGMIPVFVPPADNIPRWSYMLMDEAGRARQVAEKDRALMEAGAHANIGSYYFSQAKHFFDTVKEAIENNLMSGDEGKKEFFVAPMYQRLIDKGLRVEGVVTPEVWGLGTPADLEYFLKHGPKR